jgi:hypothetical protein
MLAFLATLPEPKRQPNLLFAAARWLGGDPDSYADLRSVLLERPAELAELMLAQPARGRLASRHRPQSARRHRRGRCCVVALLDLAGRAGALAAQAPSHATLVVFHSAVLVYVSPSKRRAFAAAVSDLDAVWLSNEAPGVLPDLINSPTPPPDTDPFVLVRDGHTTVAFTDGHGSWIHWIEP